MREGTQPIIWDPLIDPYSLPKKCISSCHRYTLSVWLIGAVEKEGLASESHLTHLLTL